MDTGILHLHVGCAVLMVFATFTSVVFTVGNNKTKPTPKWLRISHMILGPGVLLTGLYTLVRAELYDETYIWVKLALVLAAIPLGIIGARKKRTAFTLLSFLAIALATLLSFVGPQILSPNPVDYGLNPQRPGMHESGDMAGLEAERTVDQNEIGAALYKKWRCKSCHGKNGDLGYRGSKNLKLSRISDNEVRNLILNGKGVMPAAKVPENELDILVDYVMELREVE